MEFDISLGEADHTVRIKVDHYSPGRPAPHCQNHDSPAFSDSGDAPEYEYDAYFVFTTKDKKEKLRALHSDVIAEHDEHITDQIEKEAQEAAEDAKAEAAISAYEDRMDPNYPY